MENAEHGQKRHIAAADVERVVILKRVIDYDKGGVILPGIYEVIDRTPHMVKVGVNASHGGKKVFRHMGIDPNDEKLCHEKFAFELEDDSLEVR